MQILTTYSGKKMDSMETRVYYRNTVDLEDENENFVEAESLFYREGDTMILEDEDVYITFPFDKNIFRYVGMAASSIGLVNKKNHYK